MKKIAWLTLILGGVLFTSARVQASEQMVNGYLATDLQVGFPLTVATPNGSIRVLVPTASDEANISSPTGEWNAGAPVANGLSVNGSTASESAVMCPANTSETSQWFNFTPSGEYLGSIFYDATGERELSASEAQAAVGGGETIRRYLGFLCRYTGSGAIGGHFAMQQPESNIQITNLINPLAPPGYENATINQAIVLPAKIQLLSSGYNGHDGVVAGTHLLTNQDVLISTYTQEVLVSARIDEQLTFTLQGVGTGESVCAGQVTSVASQPMLVDYGVANLGSFTDAAQKILVISSAHGGYVITGQQDHLLSRVAGTCPADGLVGGEPSRDCIPNFGRATGLLANAAAAWTDADDPGLGYTVKVAQKNPLTNPTAQAMFNDGQAYSRFANRATGEPAETLASSDTIARSDIYDLCYRLSVNNEMGAGVYTNSVTYTLTATF